MAKNILEDVKFVDKFLTRDGRIAIYHRFDTKLNLHMLFVENLDSGFIVKILYYTSVIM